MNKSIIENSPIDLSGRDFEKVDELTICRTCGGTGEIKGLFHKIICHDCNGLKIDIANPLGVIEHLLRKCAHFQNKVNEQVPRKVPALSQEEYLHQSIKDFYKNSSRPNE